MSRVRIGILATVVVASLAVPAALQAVSGASCSITNQQLGIGAIECCSRIGLDNSTYVDYNTLASANASVRISIWYGTDPSSDLNYSQLTSSQAFALGTTVNQTNYPSQLTSFPLYFETCIRNNSGSMVTANFCASNQSTCP